MSLNLPAALANGLQNGAYERVGGVIRDSNSKQFVAWLREGVSGEAAKALSQPTLPKLPLGESERGRIGNKRRSAHGS